MPITIDGLDDLSTLLTQRAPQSAKRYLKKCLDGGADIFKAEAEANAPKESGTLAGNIVTKTEFESGDGDTSLTIKIGPKKGIKWGSLQEFGSQDVRGEDKNGKPFHHTAQPAQRWLTNTYLDNRERVLSVIGTEMIGLLQDLENNTPHKWGR